MKTGQPQVPHAGSANLTRNLGMLLLFIVLLQFGYPVTLYGELWAGLYMLLYAGMIFFGILIVHDEGQRIDVFVAVGVIFAVFGVWFAFAQDNRTVTLGMLVSVATFMFCLMISLLRFIFRRSSATGLDLVLGAVCIYLILGGFFAATFSTVEILAPGSFEDPQAPGEPVAWQQMVYYSYVTMATLGYGDILPITPWARSLASFETVVGTLFLTVVIARLVSAWIGPGRAADTTATR